MSVLMTILLVNLVGVVLLALYVASAYNSFIRLRTHASEAWSDIDVQMKRRYNLIPNLVETVKGYASHEKDTLERVIAARNSAMGNQGSPGEQAASENMLSGALKSLFALSEAYPDLKANTNFMRLAEELSEVEDHIQKARRYYNGNVRELNTKIESFPSNLVARAFDIKQRDFFELDEASPAREAVKVSF
ncbi:membrane protein [Iodidimonas gelatinilytica]|uniref:Membrane protein n=1 Tax=Iodidimonas gelatinilytica TaxID=1236966 RepID=A0A5A7MX78_9PROT|nr:LemA family protein [Iodidimonas gelatinilytica]GER00478.1 membrane protein [Iodidimonas gelatinilytica]